MQTHLMEAMASGVFIVVWDERGRSLGHAVFLDWHGRPVPAMGDTMSCVVNSPATGRPEKIWGRVRARHFELQTDDDGQPCVWVRVDLDRVAERNRRAPRKARWPRFSTN